MTEHLSNETIINQDVIDHFRGLERKLADAFPEVQKDAERLAKGIIDPRTANADEVWPGAWNKPLYANTQVPIGVRMVQRLEPYMDGAWKTWGNGEGVVHISKTGKGIGTAAFKAVTPEAEIVRKQTNIAMYRLFAIQGAAVALRKRAKRNDKPYAGLLNVDPGVMVPTIQSEMGPGWGHITVLHFLTDLGLGCKPDRHLMRTACHLGMVPDLKPKKVPSLSDAITINRRVRCLVERLDGAFDPHRLRYVDKVLMEISRKGLI